MTDTQHTPGPWKVTIDGYKGDELHASVCVADPSVPPGAVASLIDAAPELLAALQDCVAVPNKNRPDEVWQRARAAIAKATGA